MIPSSAPLTVTVADTASPDAPVRIWAQDVDADTRAAIDTVLTCLAAQSVRPSITATGDIVLIITTISQSLQAMVPPAYAPSLKVMLDYTTRFLCDYMLETGTTTMQVHFGAEGAAA